MEKLPFFKLEVQKEGEEPQEFIAHPNNTELFRHVGALGLQMYDHVYVDMSVEDEKKCSRIWRHNPNYERVEQFMIAKDFPIHDNLRTVNKYDIDAYDELITRETGMDTVPDDWLNTTD